LKIKYEGGDGEENGYGKAYILVFPKKMPLLLETSLMSNKSNHHNASKVYY